MCGIFGIVTRSRSESGELLKRAVRSLEHRGPDDSGTVTIELSPEPGYVGLAHTRLSILDLSALGHQPMHDPETGNWIVFNGEIYNFRELRNDLESVGVGFKSHSDTEVILAAYRVWGESCVARLGGMFAFAIWDEARKRLLLARDPMGVKPLYYYHSDQAFLFASEVRTLLDTGLVPRKVDPTGVLSFLEFGSICEPWTMVRGVMALAPGHMLTVANGSIQSREYWSPLHASMGSEPSSPRKNSETSAEELPAILRAAVLSHLVSDVPVGIFLSGGIDSSALVAILARDGVTARTFSLVFQEDEYNEAEFSREVARLFHTDHHEIPITLQDTLAILPEALLAMDQPTIDGVNTYLVSERTRATGVKVALTGLGADEMFAGYSNFRRVPRMERFSQRFGRLPRFAQLSLTSVATLFAGTGDRNRKIVQMMQGSEPAVHPYFLARELFGSDERQALFSPMDRELSQQELNRVLCESVEASQSLDPENRVSYLESHFYMRNTLLRDSDFMSMAHGLELRVPFLDRALVEACFRIPGNQKLRGNSPKPLLLASLGVELPSEIVNRPKRGFTLPFEKWLRGEMRPTVEQILLKSNWDQMPISASAVEEVWRSYLAGRTSWSRPWSLFVLKNWCDRNL